MFRREMTSKKGSLPPKEGDLTCMPQGQSARRFFCHESKGQVTDKIEPRKKLCKPELLFAETCSFNFFT